MQKSAKIICINVSWKWLSIHISSKNRDLAIKILIFSAPVTCQGRVSRDAWLVKDKLIRNTKYEEIFIGNQGPENL